MIALLLAILCFSVIFPVSGWIVNKSFDAAERFGRWLKDFHGTICL